VARRQPKYMRPSDASSHSRLCAVVVANTRGQIRLATSGARRWMQSHFMGWDSERGILPLSLLQLTHRCSGSGRTASRLVMRRDGRFTVKVVGGQDLFALVFESVSGIGPSLGELTSRQTEILAWVAEGKRNDEISKILLISPRTVQHHLERVYERLGVENRTAAARMLLTAKRGAGS
jgi:DNA-binding CsgD family transcriptional regulator